MLLLAVWLFALTAMASPSDCDLLTVFGNHTTATKQMNWNTSTHHWCCQVVRGVTCQNDRVVALDLTNVSITGQIPGSFAGLTNLRKFVAPYNFFNNTFHDEIFLPASLEYLDLSWNALSGDLPSWLFVFSNLIFLNMSNNFLTGQIPTPTAPLKVLNLGHNQVTGPLKCLQNLTRLELLDLGINQLSGPIGPIESLLNLAYIDLSGNQLNGTIEPVRNLVKLAQLFLPFNSFEGNISAVRDLVLLTKLFLAQNHLTGDISPIANLTRMDTLSIWSNFFTGPLDAIGGMTSLRGCHLEKNMLNGSLAPLKAITSLSALVLVENQLTGTLAPLASLTNIGWLLIDSNQFVGTLEHLRGLTALSWLTLENNQFRGSLSPLLALGRLATVNISSNQLSGKLDLRNLSNLEQFRASMNQFSGLLALPQSIQFLDVSNNQLTGLKKNSSLPQLKLFNVSNNSFTKTFDDLVLNTERPTLLDITSNPFQCPYPELGSLAVIARSPCIYTWTSLAVLGGVVMGCALVGGLLYFLCRKRWEKMDNIQQFGALYLVVWLIISVGTLANMMSLWQMYWYVIDEALNQDLGCKTVNDRAVFDLVFTEVFVPPLAGTNLREYVAAFYRETEMSQISLDINLQEFAVLCRAFPRCGYIAAPEYLCTSILPPINLQFMWVVVGVSAAFLFIELVKILPAFACLFIGEKALVNRSAHLVARSMLSPVLLLRRKWFIAHIVCLQSTPCDHALELVYGAIPGVVLLLLMVYFHLNVLQTDWTFALYVSIFVNAINVLYLLFEARFMCCPAKVHVLDEQGGIKSSRLSVHDWEVAPHTAKDRVRQGLSNAYRDSLRHSTLDWSQESLGQPILERHASINQ